MMFLIKKSNKAGSHRIMPLVLLCFLLSGGAAFAHSSHSHQDGHEGYWRHDDARDYSHHRRHHYRRDGYRDYQEGKRKTKYEKKRDRKIKQRLKRHFRKWEGTPYRYGGNSWKGIDCSGFVTMTYRKLFQQRLPRSTKGMLKQSVKIRKRHLRPGDLVFFREGRRNWHVGIYLDNNRFMHASSNKGVTISSMSAPYWKRHFHSARQML